MSHELAGKDVMPRGAVVFCECGGSFYAPFAQINGYGATPPGDADAAMREADRRWQAHVAQAYGRPVIVPRMVAPTA